LHLLKYIVDNQMRRMKWVWHVALKGKMRNAHWVLVEKPLRRRPLGRPRYIILTQIQNKFSCNPSSEELWVTLQSCTKLNILYIQQEMQVSILSLNSTSFYRQNKLLVSASDSSHYQADHINVKRKYLQLHWCLEIVKLKKTQCYVLYIMCIYAASGIVIKFIKIVYLCNL